MCLQLIAWMLARLGACRWFPELHSFVGFCAVKASYAPGMVSSAHESCLALLLQGVVD